MPHNPLPQAPICRRLLSGGGGVRHLYIDPEIATRPALAAQGETSTMNPRLCRGGNMSRLNSMLCVLFLLTLPALLGGCAGVLVVGGLAAAGSGGYAAGQERGVGGAVSDFQLQTDIERGFVAAGPGFHDDITTSVYQGRVLLTGHVPTPD